MLHTLVPSMFHRRLLLLAGMAVIVLCVLLFQLGRLTLVQGEQWRDRAEHVLTTQRLIPTARGSITDARDRMLAMDRPSYDIGVRYEVISGEWSYRMARADAWRKNRHLWQELSSEEKDKFAAAERPRYDARIESLWAVLCDLGDVERADLDRRRADIVRKVKQIADDVWERQQARRATEESETGEPRAMERRPVSEQKAAHTLLENVDEDALLEVRRLVAEADSEAAQRKRENRVATAEDELLIWEQVEVLPSRQREYPLENITVEVDLSRFPGPLRQDKRVDVTVEGAAWLLVGDMRPIWKEDVERRPFRRPTPDVHQEPRTSVSGALSEPRTSVSGALSEPRTSVSGALNEPRTSVSGDEAIALDSQSAPSRSRLVTEAQTDLGGYLPGDRAGRSGVEASLEDKLRGTRGRVIEYIDGSHDAIRTDPVAGSDVKLSIDVMLQARVMALMDPKLGLMRVQPWHAKDLANHADDHPGEEPTIDPLRPKLGEPLNGAAVIIDIKTGRVLAAVSVPSVTPRMLREQGPAVWNDPINRPFVNRAISQPYQPGSTIKPMVLAAAVTDRLLTADGRISCCGHLHPDQPTRYRCWIYKHFNGITHDQVAGGPLDGAAGIARSCNIFFFTLGQRLGPQRLLWWYDGFGLGRETNCGVADESRGRLPGMRRAHLTPSPPAAGGEGRGEGAGQLLAQGARNPLTPPSPPTDRGRGSQDTGEREHLSTSDAIMMGIGQGRVEWTVLQAANAYATLGRGGYVLDPTFIAGIAGDPPTKRRSEDLRLDPRGVEVAMQGLYDAVYKPYGTAHHFALIEGKPVIFDCPGVKVFGKSGTATAPPLRPPIDDNGDGLPDRYGDAVRAGDHAWFTGLIQKQGSTRPDYAIAVIVEYGGSGGAVAAPIANQILYALKAEGYL